MAVIHVLLLLLLALAVGRIGCWVIAVSRRLLRRLRRGFRGVHRLSTLRRLGDNIILRIWLVQVISACCHKEQRTAQPDFLRIRRQIVNTNPAWRLHDYIARALWAIPVTTRVKVVLTMPANTRIATGYAVDHITRAILRTWAPSIAMPVRATMPTVIAGTTVATTRPRRCTTTLPMLVVNLTIVLVVALARL